MKRLLAVLLTCSMVWGLCACGQGAAGTTKQADSGEEAETGQRVESEEGAEGAAENASSGKKDTWLCDEKTTLTLYTYDGVDSSFPAPSNDLEFWQWMEDYTNVHIEWEISPYTGYDEIVSTKMASGSDLPDILNTHSMDLANDAGRNGLLVNLSEYWDTCFTNTQAYFDQMGTDYKALISNEDGSCYGIAGMVEPIEGHIMFLYNTEWMKQLGAEVPRTLDEFTELLKKMKEAGDLNGNGEADEIILTSASVDGITSALGSAFGLEQYEGWDSFVADGSGVVTDEYTSEKMKNYLTYVSGLYADGLIDKEITTMTADTASEKIADGRVGIYAFYSAYAIIFGNLAPGAEEDPLGERYTLGYPLASDYNDNSAYFVRRDRTVEDTGVITSGCKNPELAAKWLDTLFADPEVLMTRTNGFEGVDWEYDESGEFQLIYPEDGSAWKVTQKGCGQIAFAYIQTKEQFLNSRRSYQWYLDEYDDLRENCNWVSPSVTKVTCYTDAERDKLDLCKTDVISYWEEMRDKFLTGAASVENDWDTYVSTINTLGLETMTEAYQSVYDRTAK